jgi:Rieske Fe-S protein
MAGEDQERFEDYLELEQFIAELQAGHTAQPPRTLTPAQARAYRMALLFHASTPGVSDPDPTFTQQLQARLESELQHTQQHPPRSLRSGERKRRLSRRLLLTGGAVAAASVAAGAGVEYLLEQSAQSEAPAPTTVFSQQTLLLTDVTNATDWFPVMKVAELGNQAIKFVSGQIVGYLVRSDGTNGDPAEKGQILAMSAACTHMGCLVEWSSADRRYHCPCHGGIFDEDGGVDPQASLLYLNPLPRLDVRIEDGQIYVRIPAS